MTLLVSQIVVELKQSSLRVAEQRHTRRSPEHCPYQSSWKRLLVVSEMCGHDRVLGEVQLDEVRWSEAAEPCCQSHSLSGDAEYLEAAFQSGSSYNPVAGLPETAAIDHCDDRWLVHC